MVIPLVKVLLVVISLSCKFIIVSSYLPYRFTIFSYSSLLIQITKVRLSQ